MVNRVVNSSRPQFGITENPEEIVQADESGAPRAQQADIKQTVAKRHRNWVKSGESPDEQYWHNQQPGQEQFVFRFHNRMTPCVDWQAGHPGTACLRHESINSSK
jgi:hypothetical protein